MNHKSIKHYLNVDKAFKVFSIAIIVSLLVPMILSTALFMGP